MPVSVLPRNSWSGVLHMCTSFRPWMVTPMTNTRHTREWELHTCCREHTLYWKGLADRAYMAQVPVKFSIHKLQGCACAELGCLMARAAESSHFEMRVQLTYSVSPMSLLDVSLISGFPATYRYHCTGLCMSLRFRLQCGAGGTGFCSPITAFNAITMDTYPDGELSTNAPRLRS